MDMEFRPITKYISKEQLESMNVKDEIIITTDFNSKFRIKKTNESERCFSFYNITNRVSICSRCKIDYILESRIH